MVFSHKFNDTWLGNSHRTPKSDELITNGILLKIANFPARVPKRCLYYGVVLHTPIFLTDISLSGRGLTIKTEYGCCFIIINVSTRKIYLDLFKIFLFDARAFFHSRVLDKTADIANNSIRKSLRYSDDIINF